MAAPLSSSSSSAISIKPDEKETKDIKEVKRSATAPGLDLAVDFSPSEDDTVEKSFYEWQQIAKKQLMICYTMMIIIACAMVIFNLIVRH